MTTPPPFDPSSEHTRLAYVEGLLSEDQQRQCEDIWSGQPELLALMRAMRQDQIDLSGLPAPSAPGNLATAAMATARQAAPEENEKAAKTSTDAYETPATVWSASRMTMAAAAATIVIGIGIWRTVQLTPRHTGIESDRTEIADTSDALETRALEMNAESAAASPALANGLTEERVARMGADTDGPTSAGLAPEVSADTELSTPLGIRALRARDLNTQPLNLDARTETAARDEPGTLEELDHTLNQIRERIESSSDNGTSEDSDADTVSTINWPELIEEFNLPHLSITESEAFQRRCLSPMTITVPNDNDVNLQEILVACANELNGTVLTATGLTRDASLQGELLERISYWILLPKENDEILWHRLGTRGLRPEQADWSQFDIDMIEEDQTQNISQGGTGQLLLHPLPGASILSFVTDADTSAYDLPPLHVPSNNGIRLWTPDESVVLVPLLVR